MSRLTWIQRVYWTRFSKPLSDRALVRQLIDKPIASLLEIGIGRGERMHRISQLVTLTAGCERLRYIGVDEFEAAKDGGTHMSLKTAHQLASQVGFKASLIPGDLQSAMPRVAHKFGASDLMPSYHGELPAEIYAEGQGQKESSNLPIGIFLQVEQTDR